MFFHCLLLTQCLVEQLNLPQPSVPPGSCGAAAQPSPAAQPFSWLKAKEMYLWIIREVTDSHLQQNSLSPLRNRTRHQLKEVLVLYSHGVIAPRS